MWKVSRVKMLKISGLVIVICLLFLMSIGLVSFYGTQLVTFGIKIKNDQFGLTLYKTTDLSDATTYLKISEPLDLADTTFDDIPISVLDGIGDKSDYYGRRYAVYSFYLQNPTSIKLATTLKFMVVEESKKVLSAVRIRLVKERLNVETTNGRLSLESDNEHIFDKFYAKTREYPFDQEGTTESYDSSRDNKIYHFEAFESTTTQLCNITGDDMIMREEEIDKFTVVIWLEGTDRECVDSIRGGVFRSEIQFSCERYEE